MAENKYINAEDFPDNVRQDIAAQTINSGQAMLNGESTTAFSGGVNEHANALSAGMGAVMTVGAMAQTVNNTTATVNAITNICVKKIEDACISYVSDKVAEMMQVDVAKITSGATVLMSKLLMTPDKAIEKIMTTGDDLIKAGQEASTQKAQSEMMSSASEKSGNMKKNVADRIVEAEAGIMLICSYIQNGEAWLVKNTDTYVGKVCDGIKKYVGITTYAVEEQKNKFIDSQIEKVAYQMAGPINTKLENAQKKILDEIEVAKQTAITKAKAAIASAMLKLKGMTGG